MKDENDITNELFPAELGGESNELLEEVLKQFQTSPNRLADIETRKNTYLLLRLWASLSIFILDPYTPPKRLPEKEEDGEGGEGAAALKPEGHIYADIITLENGWKIFDYGDCYATSRGENYDSMTTGDYIVTVKEMVKKLKERGVTRVALDGLDVGVFVSWFECERNDIQVANYTPTPEQFVQYERIQNVFAELSEKAPKLQL